MRLSIRLKLLLAVTAPMLLMVAVLVPLNFRALRGQALGQMEQYVAKVVELQAARFDGQFASCAAVARTTADALTADPTLTEEQLYALLRANVSGHPLIYGSCIAFEPGTRPGRPGLFAPYAWRKDGGLAQMDVASSYAYNDGTWEWYTKPLETGRALWTEPFFDSGAGDILMCTFAAPFRDATGAVRGVATVDIPLDRLQSAGGEMGLGPEEGFIIVSREGVVISSPVPGEIMTLNVARASAESGNAALAEAARAMLAGERRLVMLENFSHAGEPAKFICFAPIASTGWSLAVGVPVSDVMDPVYAKLTQRAGVAVGAVGIVGLFLLILASWLTRPVQRLAASVRDLSALRLGEVEVGVYANDEIGDLARAIASMSGRLKEQIDELTRATAAREAVESELRVAREIQAAMLPDVPVFVAAHPTFDLWAINLPARHVAGDFFDLIPMPGGELMLVIADVSGKGVPAAMFMAVVRTLLRSLAEAGLGPGAMLERANQLLLAQNERGMFVTLIVARYSPSTGRLLYANAGHPPAWILDGPAEPVRALEPTGTLVGVVEGARFQEQELELAPGARAVLYTDGVPEGRTEAGEFYGDERLKDSIRGLAGTGPREICRLVVENVERFQSGQLKDDVTVLVLARSG